MNAARFFLGAALLAAILLVAAVIWVDRSTSVTVVIDVLPESELHVAIEGAVATPGVVIVPAGARLKDVADAAGGFTDEADFTNLQLAGRVGDGERIVIPMLNAGLTSEASSVPAVNGPADTRININTATAEELQTLPRIGEVLAARIVDFRETNGPYQSPDELVDVEGISPRMVETLRPLVTVDDGS